MAYLGFYPISRIFTLFHTLLGCFGLFVLFLDTTGWMRLWTLRFPLVFRISKQFKNSLTFKGPWEQAPHQTHSDNDTLHIGDTSAYNAVPAGCMYNRVQSETATPKGTSEKHGQTCVTMGQGWLKSVHVPNW